MAEASPSTEEYMVTRTLHLTWRLILCVAPIALAMLCLPAFGLIARSNFALHRSVLMRTPVLTAPIVLKARMVPGESRLYPFTNQPYIGTVHTLAGSYQAANAIAYNGDDGNFYVVSANFSNASLYRVTPGGNAFLVMALPSTGEFGIVYDHSTRLLYIVDEQSFSVLTVSLTSGIITTLAGGTRGTADGQGSAASFQAPEGIALAANGKLYVTDFDRVRIVTTGGAVTTLTAPGSIGPQNSAQFGHGEEIAYDSLHNLLFVTDPYQNVIHQITLAGVVKTIAGQCVQPNPFGGCDFLQRDGPAAKALFSQPNGIVFDPSDGSLYIADSVNNQVRRLYKGVVTTLAGNGHVGSTDGLGVNVSFSVPVSLSQLPKSGLLYVGDTFNALIRTVVTHGRVAPPPLHGITMYDPPTTESQPTGIAATGDGSIWFTETRSAKIGRLKPTGIFVEYALPFDYSNPINMTPGGDGNLWFTNQHHSGIGALGAIGRITPTGTIIEFDLPQIGSPNQDFAIDIALGPDGNVWFLLNFGGLGVITPLGAVTEFVTDTDTRLSSGYDGAIWAMAQGVIDRFSTTGQNMSHNRYTMLSAGAIKKGPNTHMWFTQPDAMGYVVMNRVVEYLLPSPTCAGCITRQNNDLAMASDGSLWFTENGVGNLGRITSAGDFSDHLVPAPGSKPGFVVTATDGSIWFTDPGSHKIGRWR